MIIYSKFNLYRKKKFHLLTKINKENDEMSVIKTAQNDEAKPFLFSLLSKYHILRENKFSIVPIKPETPNDSTVVFPYKKYPTLDSLLYVLLLDKEKNNFVDLFSRFIEAIKNNQIEENTFGNDFQKIFGEVDPEIRYDFLQVGCLDLNFDNIILDNDKNIFILFDYEWTFNFPIPYKYVIFRALTSFYFANYDYNPNKFLSIKKLYEMAEISESEKELFIGFEYNFQKYVGDDFVTKYDDFKHSYLNLEKEKRIDSDYFQQKDQEIASKDQAIQQKDSEILQKEKIIKDKNAEIKMMKSSKFWKFRSKYLKLKGIKESKL